MAYEPEKCFKLVDEVSEAVRLAEGVGDSRTLQPRPVYRAIDALKMFHTLCKSTNVNTVIAVGTSALREATNRQAFLEQLQRVAGLTMRVLTTDEEAYYGYLGAANSVCITNGFVFDTGGGSTQVVEIRNRVAARSFSRQAGVLRFTERFVKSDPISRRDMRVLEEGAQAAFADLSWLNSTGERTLVGIGGTVRTLARIDQKRRRYAFDRTHGYILTRTALDEIVTMLRDSSLREREQIPGLNADRADVIIAGAVIVRQLMTQGGFTELTVSGNGLREGLFYEHFLSNQPRPLFENIRNFSILNLARFYDYGVVHAERVQSLSLALFDQLQPLHGYSEWERELLAHAATLHDIGIQVGYYDHHKHSAYLVLNSSLLGFTHREIVLLAMLVRNHRKGEADISEYRSLLAPDDPLRITRLSSLLRIAEYLERSKSQTVQNLRLSFEGQLIRVTTETIGDATVEVWDANRRTSLFRKAFGRDIIIM